MRTKLKPIPPQDWETLVNELRETMAKKKVTQTMLADILEVQQSSISRFFKVKQPTLKMFLKIANALGHEVKLD